MTTLPKWQPILPLLFGVLLSSYSLQSYAGISPDNVIVVVNADSHDSRTVANHYIDLREIPSSNVILLRDVPEGIVTTLDLFKTKILGPVLKEIDARKLASQIRVIAYSADFPTSVNIAPHVSKLESDGLRKIQSGRASINGLTFFHRFVMADDPSYLSLSSNVYSRGQFSRYFENPFSGDQRDRFGDAKSNLDAGLPDKAKAAGEGFEGLFKQSPTLAAIAILSARGYAKAGQQDDAIRMLKSAIRAGWWSGTFIKDDGDLAKLIEKDNQIQGALKLMDDAAIAFQGPVGFSGIYGWTSTGERVPASKGGISYMTSCMLAVTLPRGSRVSQAVEVLRRAAEADRTFPKGEFRFTLTGDVRTKTRLPGIADALVYLAEDGFKAKIFRETIPSSPGDVAGLMLGTAGMNLKNRKWNFVRGAIAETLTSLSGDFNTDAQTKLTELLHAGAAISSGTVTEPYAVQAKFPLPMMYAYYAAGVTAIEAFYLSVHSPYQLLIVGDPLCQPYARAPNEWVEIAVSNSTPKVIRFQRKPLNLNVPSSTTRLVEIYVEGRLVKQSPPVAAIRMNLPEIASGATQIGAVLIGTGANETRVWFSEEFDLKGPVPTPVAEIVQGREPDGDQAKSLQMTFGLSCPGADSVDLTHFGEVLGSVEGDSGEVMIDAIPLGDGPLRFRAVAHFGEQTVRGRQVIDRP